MAKKTALPDISKLRKIENRKLIHDLPGLGSYEFSFAHELLFIDDFWVFDSEDYTVYFSPDETFQTDIALFLKIMAKKLS